MRALPFTLPLLLAACASAAPEFRGAKRHDITLEGISFVVFHKESRAEVIRLGYLTRSERAPVAALMLRAAQETTGCTVVGVVPGPSLPGDTGEVRLALRCPASDA
jgi:hypothetical protein